MFDRVLNLFLVRELSLRIILEVLITLHLNKRVWRRKLKSHSGDSKN